MLSRRERLSRASVTQALKTGKRRSSAHFSVILPNGVRGYAVVVSKKVARLSVTRHRIKRRVLAALRDISPSSSGIIFPRAEVKDMEYDEVRSELKKLLS